MEEAIVGQTLKEHPTRHQHCRRYWQPMKSPLISPVRPPNIIDKGPVTVRTVSVISTDTHSEMALAIQPDLPGKYPNLYNIPNLYTKKKNPNPPPDMLVGL